MLDLKHERYRAHGHRTFHSHRRTSSGPPVPPTLHWGDLFLGHVIRGRGQNVRTEPEREALVTKVFEKFDTYILTGILRIPYTLIAIEVGR
jgi:hypothetical protein